MVSDIVGFTLVAWVFGMSIFIIPAMEAGDNINERVAIIIAWPIYLLIIVGRGLYSIARRP